VDRPGELPDRTAKLEQSAVCAYESVPCDLCGADDTEVLFTTTDRDMRVEGLFPIVRCRRCGLVYVNPRPTQASIGRYYPALYYKRPRRVLTRGAVMECIKRLIRESQAGYSQGLNGLQVLVGRLLSVVFGDAISVVVPFVPNGRILDVGCNDGKMVAWMVKHGWDVYGVETSPEAAKRATNRGLQVFCGDLLDAGYPSDYFDVVTMSHVLEHVHSPTLVLNEIRRVLKPNGMVMIGVPNIQCYDFAVFREDWFPIEAPRHLFHFSRETLSAILEKTGFKPSHWVRKFPFSPYVYRSIGLRREAKGLSVSAELRLRAKMYLGKPVLWAFSRNKQWYAETMGVYARK